MPIIYEDATLTRGLGEIAREENAEAFWPPPTLVWRHVWVGDVPRMMDKDFRVAYFTKIVMERKRFLCWDDLVKAFPDYAAVADAIVGAYDAFKHGAKEVELRPLEELIR
jgi:hypothetical protein